MQATGSDELLEKLPSHRLQLGGSWVGKVDPEDLPVEMAVDWVRFYQKK